MRQRFLVFGLVGILAIAAATHFATRHITPPPGETEGSTVQSPQVPAGEVAANLLAARTGDLEARAVPEAASPQSGGLRLLRTLADPSTGDGEVCLVFSAPLAAGANVPFSDFLRIEPTLKLAVRAEQSRLCLGGLKYGVDYQLTLLRGLPGADGSRLEANQALPLSLGDRTPSVRLGGGFVLPYGADDGLPVTTVNVDKLDLKLYRVGDRLLARLRADFVDEQNLASYDVRRIGEDEGRLVWSGGMAVAGERNNPRTSLIPIREAIGKREPGAYLLVASDAARATADESETEYDGGAGDRTATQWIVHSDLGLTSLRGDDGLTVLVRSLHDASPRAFARLSLIARNNEILAEATTDNDGRAHFPAGLLEGEGGAAAVMLMAYLGEDFNFLDLRRAPFDLSDRGADGRAPAGPVDAFLYTERGIYRPGETIALTVLARDGRARALADRTLVLKLMRPNGKEARRYTVKTQAAGAASLPVVLPASAARGGWEITAHTDPEAAAVGRVGFEVQDFVPQRLGLTVLEQPRVLQPGVAFALPVEARFLYGAPAAGLTGEGELIIEADTEPFPMHKGFHWGDETQTYHGEPITLTVEATDAAGRTRVQGQLPNTIGGTRPLRANVQFAIHEPGGRATREQVQIPIRTQPVALGLRPLFEGAVRRGDEARFEVIAVDAAGQRIARAGLDYRIIKDETTWQWHRRDGQWRYEPIVRERELATGRLDVSADRPATLRQPVGWGSYRLEVTDPQSGAVSVQRFYGGYYGEATAERPDRLSVATDKPGYRAGETAHLRIDSEFAGQATLVIANERVHEVCTVSVPQGGLDLEVPVRPEWGAGAYALVTFYRPLADKPGHAPVRAVGVAWLGLDPAARTLQVTIGAPGKITPRQRVEIPVTVTAAQRGGEPVWLTLAAVDEGILQLTRFKTPVPQQHYLGKRKLGVGLRDDYGRLIRGVAVDGEDQGGDGDAGESKGLDVVPTRTVALFAGPVQTDGDGKASIPLEIPDFQGELRLMAVAFDAERVGAGEARMTVRDPLVADAILPRFLAPGDAGALTVLVHNVEGAPGAYALRLTAEGAVGGESSAVLAERSLQLGAGVREVFTLPLRAGEAGIGKVVITVAGPAQVDGKPFAVTRDWSIQVRPPQAVETRKQTELLAAGQTLTLDGALLEGLLPGTVAASLSVSRFAGLDVPGLLRWLDRYPYGCLEQTTSRAMPLLYFNDMARDSGVRVERGLDARVQNAIDHVLAMQNRDGGFNMWGPWDEQGADPWLAVFAVDFLQRGAERGFDVPQAPLQLAQQWLGSTAWRDGRAEVRAYAAALLARQGKVNASELRYFHDQTPPQGPVGWVHLGAALEAIGERGRANNAFTQARNLLARTGAAYKPLPYGSRLRDIYAVAAILAQAGRAEMIPAVLELAPRSGAREGADYTTTQEKAWMLLAAAELGRNAGQTAVEVNGARLPAGDPASVTLDAAQLAGTRLHNAGATDVFRILSVEGVPAAPLPEAASGMRLSKRLFTLDGKPLDPLGMARNQRAVVVIEGAAVDKQAGDYAVLDLLPAGWEIEGVLTPELAGFAWLGTVSETQMRQARDDRFIASLNLPLEGPDEVDASGRYLPYHARLTYDFKLAYVVRAVTPGRFVLPAARAEHMYAPHTFARTTVGALEIKE